MKARFHKSSTKTKLIISKSYPFFIRVNSEDSCSLFNLLEEGVGFIGIEDFVAIHHGYQILGVGEVDDVVGIAWEHVDGLNLVAGDFPFYDLTLRVIHIPFLY